MPVIVAQLYFMLSQPTSKATAGLLLNKLVTLHQHNLK